MDEKIKETSKNPVEHGALNDVMNAMSISDYTPLHLAAMHKQADLVQQLLQRNVDVNARTCNSCSRTPLHLACECNLEREQFRHDDVVSDQLKIVRLLISHGADVNARDSSGSTPLLRTCVINQIDKIYLDDLPTDERIALTHAISRRWYKVVDILLKNKADANARTENGASILHILSEHKFLETLEEIFDLITWKVGINSVDDNGLTPLHVAVKCGNTTVAETFLMLDAKPNIKCKNSRTPMHVIIEEIINRNINFRTGHYILEALLDYGGDINALGNNGNTLLHLAVSNFNFDLTELLLEWGSDVNVKNCSGDCCISELLKNLERRNYRAYAWPELFRIIYMHVQKLMALKLPLSQSVKDSCAQLYSRYKMESSMVDTFPILDCLFKECVSELDRMKGIKIDRYTSLYDILLKSPQELTMHLKNKNFWEIIDNSYIENDFPNYCYFLKLQDKRGKKRKDVLVFAEEALSTILKTDLPDVCYQTVFKYLDDKDITVLKEVGLQ